MSSEKDLAIIYRKKLRIGGDNLNFDLTYYPEKIGVVTLYGELEHSIIQELRAVLVKAILQGELQTIIWNFANVRFMDSTAVGLILGRMKELRAVDGSILLINPNPTIEKILNMSGLGPFIFKGSESEALRFVGGRVYG